MDRRILTFLIVGIASLSVGEVLAQAPAKRSFRDQFHLDFFRNKRWPEPFRAQDTLSVMNYMEIQRNNGWRLHNTLGAGMYDTTHNVLTNSGLAHIRWIVSRAPENRRVVFVLQGDSPEDTAQRVEAAQVAISRYVPVGPLPQIYVTDIDAPGSSGAYQTAVIEAMTKSVPAPRLPSSGGQTGSGGIGQ